MNTELITALFNVYVYGNGGPICNASDAALEELCERGLIRIIPTVTNKWETTKEGRLLLSRIEMTFYTIYNTN